MTLDEALGESQCRGWEPDAGHPVTSRLRQMNNKNAKAAWFLLRMSSELGLIQSSLYEKS